MARANSLVGDADAQKRNVIRINEAETLRMDDVGDGDVDEQKRMRIIRMVMKLDEVETLREYDGESTISYFFRSVFSLGTVSIDRLKKLFNKRYGKNAALYFERTHLDWKHNRIFPSGETYQRLLELAPEFLTDSQLMKIALLEARKGVENWKEACDEMSVAGMKSSFEQKLKEGECQSIWYIPSKSLEDGRRKRIVDVSNYVVWKFKRMTYRQIVSDLRVGYDKLSRIQNVSQATYHLGKLCIEIDFTAELDLPDEIGHDRKEPELYAEIKDVVDQFIFSKDQECLCPANVICTKLNDEVAVLDDVCKLNSLNACDVEKVFVGVFGYFNIKVRKPLFAGIDFSKLKF